MRPAIILGVALAAAALAGCFTNEDAESTQPSPPVDDGQAPFDPASADTTGCTGGHVGSGTGDIGAPRVCDDANETNETNASI